MAGAPAHRRGRSGAECSRAWDDARTGTSRITKIDLVRNNAYVYSAKGDGNDAEVKYTDMKPADGWNLYYFRVTQDDGEIAWASPVWVKVTAGK